MNYCVYLLGGNNLYAAVDGYCIEKDKIILILLLLLREIRFLRRKINI